MSDSTAGSTPPPYGSGHPQSLPSTPNTPSTPQSAAVHDMLGGGGQHEGGGDDTGMTSLHDPPLVRREAALDMSFEMLANNVEQVG